LAQDCRLLVSVEEHIRTGGLGSAVLEALSDAALASAPAVLRLGLPDSFAATYGSQDSLLQSYGLQPDQLANSIKQAFAGVS